MPRHRGARVAPNTAYVATFSPRMRAAADQRAAAAADPHSAAVAARCVRSSITCPTARRELPRGCSS
eukprot:1488745-Prymnesium_polylepis.1